MTIFKSNFSSKTPSPDNNNSQPECYFIIYKSPEFTLNCDGKDTMVELPVAPEQVYLYSNDPWWAANQHRIKQTIKCTDVSQRIDNNGSGSICVSSNNIKDCISITPDEEKLLNFIMNNDCSAPSGNTISIWYNNILQTYPSLSGTKNGTYLGINGSSTTPGEYLVFAWPSSYGTPTFTINGLPNTAWTKIGISISFTNMNSYANTYDVWISNTAQNSPITSFVIS